MLWDGVGNTTTMFWHRYPSRVDGVRGVPEQTMKTILRTEVVILWLALAIFLATYGTR